MINLRKMLNLIKYVYLATKQQVRLYYANQYDLQPIINEYNTKIHKSCTVVKASKGYYEIPDLNDKGRFAVVTYERCARISLEVAEDGLFKASSRFFTEMMCNDLYNMMKNNNKDNYIWAERLPLTVKVFNDPWTYDTIIQVYLRVRRVPDVNSKVPILELIEKMENITSEYEKGKSQPICFDYKAYVDVNSTEKGVTVN